MEEKKQRGGKREGAGRPKATNGKSLYFRFRCTQEIYDIIHAHEPDMSTWVSKAIKEKWIREQG